MQYYVCQQGVSAEVSQGRSEARGHSLHHRRRMVQTVEEGHQIRGTVATYAYNQNNIQLKNNFGPNIIMLVEEELIPLVPFPLNLS